MRSPMLLVLLGLVTACTGPSAEPSSTTTTVPPTTTTTVDAAQVTRDTCDALKIASFDVGTAIRAALADVDPIAVELDDAAVGVVVAEALVAFYDQVGSIAADAPSEIAEALTTVSLSVDPWRTALAEGGTALEAALEDLDPETIGTAETEAALETLDGWTADACGAPIPLDVEGVVLTTVFAAMMAAFGSAFGAFGDDLLDSGDGFAVALGDDPRLDAMFFQCDTGDGAACMDLYFSAYGEYELWGQTCGATIPLRRAFTVDCEGKFAGEAASYGEDFVLDSLWDQCEGGDPDACDGLFAAAPFGSAYEAFGASCADSRLLADVVRPCAFVASGEPFGYGDDVAFDQLWDACARADREACSDLFLQTPIGSAYEAFGRVCGDLTEQAKTCENAAEWVGGPGA
jgi:hypothetical protein